MDGGAWGAAVYGVEQSRTRLKWLSSRDTEVWGWKPHEVINPCVRSKSLQSCLTLCDSMDCSPPGSSVHGILRARMLEHVVISFCRGSCQPGIGPASLVSPGLQADSLPPAPPSWGLYIYLKPRHNQASNDTPPETVGDIRRLKHGLAPLIAQLIKNLHAVQETPPRFLGWEDPLEKGDTTHCSIVGLRVAQLVKNLPAMWETWVRKIPWRRERLSTSVFWPGESHGLYGPWSLRVGHDWVSFAFTFKHRYPGKQRIFSHWRLSKKRISIKKNFMALLSIRC